MSAVILSHAAFPELKEYLLSLGHTLKLLEDDPRFGPGVKAHADLRYCKLGPRGPVLSHRSPPLTSAYPDNAAMCAVVLDGFLIHRLDSTAAEILEYCRERGLRPLNVRQGYARCSCVPVDGKSLITPDPGIYGALSQVPELSVLKIREGHVRLPGYPWGFLGGASGRVGDEIVFNGDLSVHPDFPLIRDFIASRGLGVRFFPGRELTDIGSIIETEENMI